MLWSAFVESDTGETLAVIGVDRLNFGKPLLAFEAPLDLYCLQALEAEEERQWFSRLDQYTDGELCHLVRPFLDSLIAGDWKYTEDEYEFFRRRTVALPMTEEQFRQGLERANNAWTDINILITGTEKLVEALTAAHLEATYWYDPQETIAGFETLYQVLSLLAKRGAQKARIRID